MPRSSKTRTTGQQLLDLSTAAPQVIAHRMTRMALASPTHPSSRDRKEFTGMVLEKQLAFTQSWWTLWMEMAKAQQSFMVAAMNGPVAMAQLMARAPAKIEKISSRSVAPIHRKAVSNARRLARTPITGKGSRS